LDLPAARLAIVRRFASAALGLAALAAGWGFAAEEARAATQVAPLRGAALHAAASLQAIYGGINSAEIEIYLAGALLDPRLAVGETERCLRTDNALGTVASPLAAPPFPGASIAQRRRLVEALAAYLQTVAALAGDAAPAEVSEDLGDLGEATAALKKSAGVHAERDLAIAGPAATLAASADVLGAQRPRGAALERAFGEADPTIVALIDILGKDASARHAEALSAAGNAYAAWIAVYDRVRNRALAGAARAAQTPASVRRCAAPAYGARAIPPLPGADAPALAGGAPPAAAAVAPIDAQADAATLGARFAVLARVEAAAGRYRALKGSDASATLGDLRNVNDALLQFVRRPGDAQAAATLQAAIGAFRGDAESLYAESTANLAPRAGL
jgi:hypothetical protein